MSFQPVTPGFRRNNSAAALVGSQDSNFSIANSFGKQALGAIGQVKSAKTLGDAQKYAADVGAQIQRDNNTWNMIGNIASTFGSLAGAGMQNGWFGGGSSAASNYSDAFSKPFSIGGQSYNPTTVAFGSSLLTR